MRVRPTFIFFDFSEIKSQIRIRERNKHSSESKSSDDDYGKFFYAKVWYFYANSLPNPWSSSLIRISPSLITKGYRTIITNKRFRAFLVGGSNSRQTYEF